MSTVVELNNGLKLTINADDHNPPHVHVIGRGGIAIINLRTFRPMIVKGFSLSDLRKINSAVRHYAPLLLAKWDELHGKEEG
ncbi:MAG: hypothetical protein A2428_03050 [Bdellovibrionales bacterium RIFOXYC1_FULL_54_43]|nr:MAG: hypothetical protein A2428_03050 [Bdellovibrionales bacterium RIFOXYC1_FULL_54_43]OFZ82659.1 MAG: hypothetical protein A2603_02485 [Bdellovibrionales bacterium RIFOXYD1_FULL_55_31]